MGDFRKVECKKREGIAQGANHLASVIKNGLIFLFVFHCITRVCTGWVSYFNAKTLIYYVQTCSEQVSTIKKVYSKQLSKCHITFLSKIIFVCSASGILVEFVYVYKFSFITRYGYECIDKSPQSLARVLCFILVNSDK